MVKTFHYQKAFLYSTQQLFDLVLDIESYPLFLPWCIEAKILRNYPPSCDKELYGQMTIGYKMFRSSYVSRIEYEPARYINVEQYEGPFAILKNQWIFQPLAEDRSLVRFYIAFEFKSLVFDRLLQAVFEKAAQTMIECFEKRAAVVYGQPLDSFKNP
jgi:coenzyme Q-binding protein COQ10